MDILIKSNDTELTAEIHHDEFAEKLQEVLPVDTSASTWGDEVYFRIPVEEDLDENATDVVDPGTVTYWVQGSAMAIPYGPTPASHDDECRLAARVNIRGKLTDDPERLDEISAGDPIRIEST